MTSGCYSAPLVPTAGAALAVAWALWGPPKLPPLPGERPLEPPPSEAQPTAPSKPGATPVEPKGPAPQKPTATQVQPAQPSPAPQQPAPMRPVVPPQARATPPIGLPSDPPLAPTSPAAGPTKARPEVSEPPPSETSGPALADAEPKAGARSIARGGTAAGAEPLPGGDDDDERPLLRLPPPRRPPYSGVGMFVGAGITFSAAISEQIVAHVLVKRRCIEPFASQSELNAMTPEEVGNGVESYADALVKCVPGVLPAMVLRVQSDLSLLATIGLASAGAALRAQRRAYDDAFGDRPPRRMLGLRAAGLSLLGTGVVTWLTTSAISWGLLASCRDAKCATRARLMAFTTRDTSVALIAAGGGMLTYAVAHGRAYDRFFRDRALSVGTAWLPGGGGVSLSGRF